MDKKRLAGVLIVPFTVALLVLLLMQTSVPEIIGALSSVSPAFVLLSFLLYILLNGTRASRFSVMLKNPRGLGALFNIVCIHNLANAVLPFRTGEFAFVYLARVRLNTPLGIGMATVTLARLFDVLGVCLIFILSLAVNRDFPGSFAGATPVVILIAVALVALIVSAVWFSRYLVDALGRISAISYMRKLPLAYVRSKLEEVSAYYSSRESRRGLIRVLLLSLLIWILYSGLVFLLIIGMGIGLNAWAVVIGVLLSVVFSSLPIQGVGNFGSFELVWSVVFVALGATREAAVSSGFAVHIIILAFAVVLWAYAIAADHIRARGASSYISSSSPPR